MVDEKSNFGISQEKSTEAFKNFIATGGLERITRKTPEELEAEQEQRRKVAKAAFEAGQKVIL